MHALDPQLLDLAEWRTFAKNAFVPPTDPNAAAGGGMPPGVGAPPPGAGGPPPGAPPMDPNAAPPMGPPPDPSMGAPMDPSAGGMPPGPPAPPPDASGGATPDIAGMITQAVQAGIAAGTGGAASGQSGSQGSGAGSGSSKGGAGKLDPSRLFEEQNMLKKLVTGLYQQLGLHLPNDILDGLPKPDAGQDNSAPADNSIKQANIDVGSPSGTPAALFQQKNAAVAELAGRCRNLFTQYSK